MSNNNIEIPVTFSDSEILSMIPHLSVKCLKMYRNSLKRRNLLATRERLSEQYVEILRKIVILKHSNTGRGIFYERLIEQVLDSALSENNSNALQGVINRIFDDTTESLINEKFSEIATIAGLTDDEISNFFNATTLISDFFRRIGSPATADNFNQLIDIYISSTVCTSCMR